MDPLLFIDSINSKKHLMLVYNDAFLGRAIEFHFIKKGLEKKEHCIYVTHGDSKDVKLEMKKHGIDFEQFKNNRLLRVYQMPNLLEGQVGILDGIDKAIKEMLGDIKGPCRITGRLVPDVSLEEAMAIQEYAERITHNGIFEKLNCSILCSYDFSQIQANNKWIQWLAKLQASHHASILNIDTKGTVTISVNELD